MPEGPEIRRSADRLAKVLVGHTVNEVFFYHEHLRAYAPVLSGSKVVSISSRSKAMITAFDCDLSVYTHNQLYGRWYVCRQGKTPRTQRSLRFAIETHISRALLYSASDIEVWQSNEIDQHPYLSKLGPDALDQQTSVADVLAQMESSRFAGRALAGLLLDQSFVAGLGNYLRSEILFFAQLHPSLKPRDLDTRQKNLLAETILRVTRLAYATAGVTNFPDQVNALRTKGMRREQYRFAVFARACKPCYLCRAKIQRSTMSARRIYVCPECQRKPRVSASQRTIQSDCA